MQQRIERDHQHLKGRLRPMHGVKTLANSRVLCQGHAFVRNSRRGFFGLGGKVAEADRAPRPPLPQARATLTSMLLGR